MDKAETQLSLTIGAVSKAVGVPTNTLRTWERRYGFPVAQRTDSGHRLYSEDVVPQLQLIAGALERGHRPRQVVGLSIQQLRKLVPPTPAPATQNDADRIGPWIEAASQLDAASFDGFLAWEAERLGLERFITHRVVELLHAIGEAWVRGELRVYQEHWASERVRDFLSSRWRPLARLAKGPQVVCAGLPGEQHVLGLHLVAGLSSLVGAQVVFLGADTPPNEILGCVEQTGAKAVAISISSWCDPKQTKQILTSLRQELPSGVALIVGGRGAPENVKGIVQVSELVDLMPTMRSELRLV